MGKTVEIILREAMQLSDIERAKLVDELLTTLEGEKDSDVDATWAREIEKRAIEISQGTVTPIIWDEVKEKAYKRVHAKN